MFTSNRNGLFYPFLALVFYQKNSLKSPNKKQFISWMHGCLVIWFPTIHFSCKDLKFIIQLKQLCGIFQVSGGDQDVKETRLKPPTPSHDCMRVLPHNFGTKQQTKRLWAPFLGEPWWWSRIFCFENFLLQNRKTQKSTLGTQGAVCTGTIEEDHPRSFSWNRSIWSHGL